MKKLSSSLPHMLLSLGGICLVVSGILAGVHLLTKGPIADSEMQTKIQAISAVTPKFDNNPYEERQQVLPPGEADSLTVYPAKKSGRLVGFAIESYTMKGFSGLIRVMVGFDTAGRLVDFSVLQHSESPGLGSRIPEWFHDTSDPSKLRNVRGLDMTTAAPLSVTKDGGKVDAITAATISSRAFLDAVNRAWATCQSLQQAGAPASPTEAAKPSATTSQPKEAAADSANATTAATAQKSH